MLYGEHISKSTRAMTSLRNSLRLFSWAMQQRLTPGARCQREAFVTVLGSPVPMCCHLLDLGCGHELLPSWQSVQERIRWLERSGDERWRHTLIRALRRNPQS